jgi:hypothetical protein
MALQVQSAHPGSTTTLLTRGIIRSVSTARLTLHNSRLFGAAQGQDILRGHASKLRQRRIPTGRQQSAVVMVLTESKTMEIGTKAPSFTVPSVCFLYHYECDYLQIWFSCCTSWWSMPQD